ncbi:MAG: hypothetical protein IPH87_18250 [Anaerolineae bacterium]|nr:hypothetical protein [Anaerolineae bacterium]
MTELLIIAALKMHTALHIGGMGGDHVTDDLVRRDAQGRLFIPGSAIAGPLRAILTRLASRLGSDPCQALRGATKNAAAGFVSCSEKSTRRKRKAAIWVDVLLPYGSMTPTCLVQRPFAMV